MRYPAWVGRDGFPLSWAHFVVGLRRMGDESAREELRVASGTRLGQADDKSWKAESAKLQRRAGLK